MKKYIYIILFLIHVLSPLLVKGTKSIALNNCNTLAPISSLFEFYNHIQYVLNHEETIGRDNIYKYVYRQYVQKKKMSYFSVDGLSSVGKTTFTYDMAKYFQTKGYNPVIVHLDNYSPFGKTPINKIINRLKRIAYSVIEGKGIKVFSEFEFDDISGVINRLSQIKQSGQKAVLQEPNLTVIDAKGKFSRTGETIIDENTIVLFEGTFVAHQLAKTNLIDKYIMISSDVERQLRSHKQRTLNIIKKMLNPFNRAKWSESLFTQVMRYTWYPFVYRNFFAKHYYTVYKPHVDRYTDLYIDNTNFALPVMKINEVSPVAIDNSTVSLVPNESTNYFVESSV